MSAALRAAMQRKVHALTDAVEVAVHAPATPHDALTAMDGILSRAVDEVSGIQARLGLPRGKDATAPTARAEEVTRYFPVASAPRRAMSASELQTADRRWEGALARGQRFREEARSQVGPLLAPSAVAARLGVSKATVTNWRRARRLLAVSFDRHQYLYPEFQFVDSPALGEHGVLHHVADILAALGDVPAWEQVLFFLQPAPLLGGRTPLEILRGKHVPDMDVERVLRLAHNGGEMGT